MKKFFIILLVMMMSISVLAGCDKTKDPEPTPTPDPVVEVKPMTLDVVKVLVKGIDETADSLNGTYTILANSINEDKAETKVAYHGENDKVTYDAEYIVKSTFKDGNWGLSQYELVSQKKTDKPVDPPVDPNTNNTTDPNTNNSESGNQENNQSTEGPQGTSENDPTKYLTMIEKYYTDKKYDKAELKNVKIENDRITCDVVAEETYKYIADVDYLHSVFLIKDGKVSISSETLKKQDTISNFTGKYVQKSYSGFYSDKMKPYIIFTRDWQFEMYVIAPEDFFGEHHVLVAKGSYSISNANLTMKPKGGWKNNGYTIGGGSEINLVPNNGTDAINFGITANSVKDVSIKNKIGTSQAGSHFVKE